MRRRTTPITESVETLRQLENQYRHQPQELRLKALRLLKENPNATLQQVAHLLRRHLRTVQRGWKIYQEQGLQGAVQFSKGGEASDAASQSGVEGTGTAVATARVRRPVGGSAVA